jgi:hypothetical protein
VNVNRLFAATVTIMVAAEAVKLWARAATTMLVNIVAECGRIEINWIIMNELFMMKRINEG